MAHNCPDCGQACNCAGDGQKGFEQLCTHCADALAGYHPDDEPYGDHIDTRPSEEEVICGACEEGDDCPVHETGKYARPVQVIIDCRPKE